MRKKVISVVLILVYILNFSFMLSSNGESQITFDTIDEMKDYLDSLNSDTDAVNIVKPELNVNVRSCVLMEASTGTVLYEVNKDEKLPPASVTKVMTLLLIMEAIDNGNISFEDQVTTSEHAASMGGTQIYLEVGETMTVDELIKAIAVPSANDATVAMAEYLAGSEEEFVRRMNERAKELGMNSTNFTCCTGLFDDDNHVTSAYDIAVMTRELLKHPKILSYTTIWMDTLRDGGFGLANTNKMLRTYSGMNGMKTGYTKKSMYCFSGTAERDGMTLIATVMGSPTSQDRFAATAKMLDFGFSGFSVVKASPEAQQPIKVNKGKVDTVPIEVVGGLTLLVGKGQEKLITSEISIADSVDAPIEKGTEVGTLTYKLKDEVVQTCPIIASETVPKATFIDYFG